MVGTYPLVGAEGRVTVTKEGLYYRFVCQCRPKDTSIFRLVAVSSHGRLDLGILVPLGEEFGLDKRIPCKQLGEETPEFHILPKSSGFFPVYPEEPFAYISRLKGAFLEVRGGTVGIVIPK